MDLRTSRNKQDITQLSLPTLERSSEYSLADLRHAVQTARQSMSDSELFAAIAEAAEEQEPGDHMIMLAMMKILDTDLNIEQFITPRDYNLYTREIANWKSPGFVFQNSTLTYLAILFNTKLRAFAEMYLRLDDLIQQLSMLSPDYVCFYLVCLMLTYPELVNDHRISRFKQYIADGLHQQSGRYGLALLAMAKLAFPDDPVFANLLSYYPTAPQEHLPVLEEPGQMSKYDYMLLVFLLTIVLNDAHIVDGAIVVDGSQNLTTEKSNAPLPNHLNF